VAVENASDAKHLLEMLISELVRARGLRRRTAPEPGLRSPTAPAEAAAHNGGSLVAICPDAFDAMAARLDISLVNAVELHGRINETARCRGGHRRRRLACPSRAAQSPCAEALAMRLPGQDLPETPPQSPLATAAVALEEHDVYIDDFLEQLQLWIDPLACSSGVNLSSMCLLSSGGVAAASGNRRAELSILQVARPLRAAISKLKADLVPATSLVPAVPSGPVTRAASRDTSRCGSARGDPGISSAFLELCKLRSEPPSDYAASSGYSAASSGPASVAGDTRDTRRRSKVVKLPWCANTPRVRASPVYNL